MNILTKISVVVLVLLVLVFCPVLITLATLQPNYKWKLDGEVGRNALLSQQVQMDSVLLQHLSIQGASEKTSYDSDKAKIASDAAKLDQQLVEEKARSADLEGRLTSVDQTLKEQQQNLKAMNDRNVKLVTDLDAERAQVNQKTEENRRLGEALNRQTLNAQTAQDQVAFLREKNAQQEEMIANLEKQVGKGGTSAGASVGEAPVAPNSHVVGTLTAVKGDIASINCGAAKGIKVGMIATVSRGADYVCQLQIQNVDPGQAAGVVIKKKLDPALGDKFDISSER